MLWLLITGTGLGQKLPSLNVKKTDLQAINQVEHKALSMHDSLLLAEAWYRYGELYERVSDNEQAEPYFLKALRILESHRDSTKLLKIYFRLSEMEQRQAHLSEALSYANRALSIAKGIPSVSGLIEAYRRLGHVRHFIWNGKSKSGSDSVYACYLKSGQLATAVHDTLGIAVASVYLGSFVLNKNPTGAIPYLTKAFPLFVHLNHTEWQIKTLIHLSDAYRRTGKLPMAWQSLEQAKHICADQGVVEHGIQAMLEDRTSQYYRATGEWEKALYHFERLNELERLQLIADRNGAVTRLNIEYQTQKKEAQLRAQQKEINLSTQTLHIQQRFTLLASLLFITVAGLSVVFFRLYRKNQRTSRQNQELVKEQNHRVKNNLQVVSSLLSLQAERLTDEVAKRAVEESQLRVQAMAILHRRLYDGEQLAQVDMSDFIRELVSGVIQTFDWANVSILFDLAPIYLSADKAIPLGLILNELTTNACKYAFPSNDAPAFWIRCQQKGRTVQLRVADNGPGLGDMDVPTMQMDDLLVARGQSFGLILIQSQVAQLNGTGRFGETREEYTPLSGSIFFLEFKV